MRRRAQASIIAALFVLVAFAVLAVGFANVLMAQQNYASQFQQAVQTDQTRSAESLTIIGYYYSGGAYYVYVKNNAPIASEILRVYYYNSTYFNWKWVNMSVGPGATVKVPIVVNTPITNPSFALVTALGDVFTYAPMPPLPMPASYMGQIWGGDTYTYEVSYVSRNSTGELGYNVWSTASPAHFTASNMTIRYHFTSRSNGTILVIYAEFYPPYMTSVSASYSINSRLAIEMTGNPSQSPNAFPKGYAVNISTVNYYNASTIELVRVHGTKEKNVISSSPVWFSPYKFHAIKFTGEIISNNNHIFLVYLDGVAVMTGSYKSSGNAELFNSTFIGVTNTCWYVSLISAYKNDTVNVYNVPAGWKVEIIGTDAIGRPVFLEAVNTASVPSTVTINIDNYYAPITGQLVVTP
ncbi:hypothetical protein [Conexivisphaera calida]|uniref:Uncharacterized protein n=1 Tax=Conexivisphaera calida TaxID=1874277 RepID=A0A4P2VCV0_9ARCH|nr:hypothetical protein [Conexivisphaera calida]BBE41971.1 hypothetical protein NAS2_0582 [Conexivisphaera calida]